MSDFDKKLAEYQNGQLNRYMDDIDRQQAKEEAREKFIEDKLTVADLIERLKKLPEDAVIFVTNTEVQAMEGVPDIDEPENINYTIVLSWDPEGDDDNVEAEFW